MKTIKINIPILALIIMVLTSCEKTVTNVDLPDIEPQFVIQSFLSPQNGEIIVYVSLSSPVFGEMGNNGFTPFVDDATVVITEGSDSKTIPFNTVKEYYEISTANFPIIAGRTYTLNVSTPDGKSCNAKCTVPLNLPTNFEVVEVKYSDNMEDNYVKTRLKDISGEENYYRIFAYNKDTYKPGDTTYRQLQIRGRDELFTDINNDGEWIGKEFYFYENKLNLLVFDILNVDEHYYNYHRAVLNNMGENPFAEPVIVYSNINNGLGVFCAYNEFSVEVDVK